MRLKHFDYIILLMGAYREKRANNTLSHLLSQSSPAKIRQACVHEYMERHDKKGQQAPRKDEQILRDFFGPAEPREFLQLIRDFDTNRFRPLDKYLKRKNETTDQRNLELLAWLIDFKHRPYSSDNNVVLSEKELSLIEDDGSTEPVPGPEENGLQENSNKPANPLKNETGENGQGFRGSLEAVSEKNTGKNKYKRAALIFLILIICTGGIYAVWQQKQAAQMIMGNPNISCMYWANDHYEQVPCNEERKGRIFLPLDEKKINSFKMITKKDTITKWSIGRVYYIKEKGTIKYFTEAGNYPEDLNRPLKVLSPYMFEKYLRKNEVPGKDSLIK